MRINDFVALVKAVEQKNPIWFGLPSDDLPREDEIKRAALLLRVRFPREYVEFIERYGGGYFAFVNIFSVMETSEWYIVTRNQNAPFDSESFLAVSDNGTGDYYGFEIDGGVCLPEIKCWDHEEEKASPSGYEDLYEYIARVGLMA